MNFRSNFLLLLVVGLAAACSANTSAPSEPIVLTIEGHDIRYEPETIEVTAGQQVELIFENVGALDHDINFDKLPTAKAQMTANQEGDSQEADHEEKNELNDAADHETEEELSDHNDAADHETEEELSDHNDAADHETEEELSDHNDAADHETEEELSDHNAAAETDEDHMHPEAALHLHTSNGEKATVTFTPTEPGTYEFYCTIPGHRESGMIGQLIVAAP